MDSVLPLINGLQRARLVSFHTYPWWKDASSKPRNPTDDWDFKELNPNSIWISQSEESASKD